MRSTTWLAAPFLLVVVYFSTVPDVVFAQRQNIQPDMSSLVDPTAVAERSKGEARRSELMAASLLSQVPFRNVGPSVMSGRVTDIDAFSTDPTHFYVAYASGGLWRTNNNGQSFEPLFDQESVMTIGDIAIDWTHGETIWVGTGENNSSRSSYAGNGIYRSTDGGETWEHRGLQGTQRTGRIVLHPDNPQVLWVAAAGALYSPNPERGVYKSSDGGASWEKVLFVDDETGAIDLIIDPNNPDVLYAATWHRARRAWNFVESGAGSGIYKTTDGGANWTKLNTENSGFPVGDGVGRIGLAIHPSTGVLFALLDNQKRKPEEDEEDADEVEAVTKEALRRITRDEFLLLEEKDIEQFLRSNGFPSEYDGAGILELVRNEQIVPMALVEFLEDANSQLFDTRVIGAEVYRSDDGGDSWIRTHEDYLDGLYNSYGYYFGEIRVAPDDDAQIYIMGVPILRSDDSGRTFKSVGARHVHGDHQALWINPNRSGHLIDGNDGGLNISYDHGETWSKVNIPSVGQFYAIQVDDAEPYKVYGGLQDNGIWSGPSTYSAGYGWYASGRYPYTRIGGGDGMQVEVDTRTNDIVYTGSQFGAYSRINTTTNERESVRPRHKLGEAPLRFNWQTPIHLSRHNQDILYYGANRLFRSMNQGEDMKAISPDLTRGGQPGDVPYGTLTTIDESPLEFGLIYTGSDDGYIHVTRDGGQSWNRISDSLPQNLWVSRVEASAHEKGRVYVTLNGYRWDNFESHVYRSDDFGKNWTRIGLDLPAEPVNVVVEDPHNPDLIFVGTDHGVYASLNQGGAFMAMFDTLPRAPVHDLKIQAREKDLVIGTHGRSIFIASIIEVEEMTPALIAEELHLFSPDPVFYSSFWGRQLSSWSSPVEPEQTISFYSRETGSAEMQILTEDGAVLQARNMEVRAGLNYLAYELTVTEEGAAAYNEALEDDEEEEADEGGGSEEKDKIKLKDNGKRYLVPGSYTVRFTMNGVTAEKTLLIKTRDGR